LTHRCSTSRHHFIRLVISLACILIALQSTSSLAAQQTPALELDPVVVTAAAFPAQEGEVSANVTIITREEIERQQAVTLSEILTQVPGLHVDESGARGGLSSVYIRGGDPNFTTILIDGIPINDPTNARGGSVDLSTLAPEHIERIEIVRGPASSPIPWRELLISSPAGAIRRAVTALHWKAAALVMHGESWIPAGQPSR
jgi:outer membrane cobalamin receptor